MFGIRSQANQDIPSLPYAIADDSNGDFPLDTQGIIRIPGDDDPFFGIVDTINGIGSDVNVATWTFDTSSLLSGMELSIDFAAMGDFDYLISGPNTIDSFVFEYAIDDGPLVVLFGSTIDEDASQNYTMANSTPVILDDPVLINGVMLTNSFITLSEGIPEIGNSLTLRFTAECDGGSEAFAFRNIEVYGVVPEPASIALFALGCCFCLFRGVRRKR